MRTVTAILGRSAGGISIQPFIGKSECGERFFLKPCGSLAKGLIAEFIGSSLAKEMGLPVADFEIVSIPTKLAKLSLKPEFLEVTPGPAFASRALGNDYIDLTFDSLSQLPESQLAELYLFDFWIRNSDRILGLQAGNPNALVSIVSGELAIIDHDSAFSSAFSPSEHLEIHLASSARNLWADESRQETWLKKAGRALESLPHYWQQLPEEWLSNQFGDSRSNLSQEELLEILQLPFLDKRSFWAQATAK